jgi:hypothetical protein
MLVIPHCPFRERDIYLGVVHALGRRSSLNCLQTDDSLFAREEEAQIGDTRWNNIEGCMRLSEWQTGNYYNPKKRAVGEVLKS